MKDKTVKTNTTNKMNGNRTQSRTTQHPEDKWQSNAIQNHPTPRRRMAIEHNPEPANTQETNGNRTQSIITNIQKTNDNQTQSRTTQHPENEWQ